MSTKKLTQQQFLNRCSSIHGLKFNYSKTTYQSMWTKIEIGCNTCNHSWFVSPANHVGPKKSGCPNCKASDSASRNKLTFNTNWFVDKSTKAHGTKFDYSNTNYTDTKTKVSIVCHTHGEFEQWPSDHMNGIGCSKCSGTHKKSSGEFIDAAIKIFPEYNYSLVNYTNAHVPVDIICGTHGKFQIKPNSLLNTVGCGKCSITRQLTTKIQKGIIRDPKDLPEYEKYRREVWRISNQQFVEHYYIINPFNIKRGPKFHLDHKYSIQQGWKNNVSPEIIGVWKNLQLLPAKQNQLKSSKCSVTLESIS